MRYEGDEHFLIMPYQRREYGKQKLFNENKMTKIQLTWRNISIIAPPKKILWRRISPDKKGYTILGKIIRIFRINFEIETKCLTIFYRWCKRDSKAWTVSRNYWGVRGWQNNSPQLSVRQRSEQESGEARRSPHQRCRKIEAQLQEVHCLRPARRCAFSVFDSKRVTRVRCEDEATSLNWYQTTSWCGSRDAQAREGCEHQDRRTDGQRRIRWWA